MLSIKYNELLKLLNKYPELLEDTEKESLTIIFDEEDYKVNSFEMDSFGVITFNSPDSQIKIQLVKIIN